MERSSRNGFIPDAGQGAAESPAHGELKRLAIEWARSRRLALAAMEVRLPRSAYRADVAAATPRALASNALTAIFECKASRADFLRDSAPEMETAGSITRLRERLDHLHALIGGHRPDLRRSEELFPEFEAFDLRGLRHRTHDRLEARLAAAQRKLQGGTKFSKLSRWRSASLLYLVAEEGLFAPDEIPTGWGLLVRRDARLELAVKPCLRDTTAEERVALLERIAAAATRGSRNRQPASGNSSLPQHLVSWANFTDTASAADEGGLTWCRK